MGGLGMENVSSFYGYLEYIIAMWYVLGPFDNLLIIWYIFPRFGMLFQEQSGTPDALAFSCPT
jgi:hypothetical protein